MRALTTLLGLFCISWTVPGEIPTQERRPLDHEASEQWKSVTGTRLSSKGCWILYEVSPANGDDGVLYARGVRGDSAWQIERGTSARFDYDERHLVCLVAPAREEVRAAKKSQKKPSKGSRNGDDDEPKSALAILDLAGGERVEIERVKSFRMPEERGGWVAYLKEKALEKKGEEAGEDEPQKEPEPGEAEAKPSEEEEEEEKDEKKKKDKKDGTELVLRDLASGEELAVADVVSYAFAKDGRHLAYVTSTKEEGDDGLHVVELERGTPHALLEGEGDYRSIVFDESSTRIAFLSNRDDYEADQPAWTLYYAEEDDEAARAVATAGTPGVPEGWGVSEHRPGSGRRGSRGGARAPSGALRFSESGTRILFGTAPLPEPEPEEGPEDEKVVLDVWSWTDPYLQPQQLKEQQQELERSYLAILHLDARRVVQLASIEVPEVSLAQKDDSAVAIGTSNLPWRKQRSWDTNLPQDVWVIDVSTGRQSKMLEASRGSHRLSPAGRYVYWWSPEERAWHTLDVTDGEIVHASAGVPHRLDDELQDTPQLHRSYGSASWLEEDAGLVVYDRHDLWLLDPRGEDAPACVTEEVGRRDDLRFRYVNMDPDQTSAGGSRFRGGGEALRIDPEEPLLLSAFDRQDKSSGFWRDHLAGGEPSAIVMEPKSFSTPVRAKRGDVLYYTRSDYAEFPDLWVSDLDFAVTKRVSDANPQQKHFLWGTAEPFEWHSTDGVPLQGILYKPERFEESHTYPLVVYFYERLSDRLHRYHAPNPGRSSVAYSYYTSNDYLVFLPDIPYRTGYPGPSAEAAILPALTKLIDTGFVDERAIGVQGHSWGGYQIAHLVTRTNVFAAAVSGAPVSNMTSAYGGIRWSSGMSRMFQYERSQSRLGGSLWEVPNRFWENSPIFFADKIETPVLILHNDEDGAVPWYQGIEFFVALRRLSKPAWLLNYNGEAHGLGKFANRRDYARRMSQFFDHYLKGAPPPVWMVEGIPATMKGRTLGLELVEPAQLGAE